MQIYQQQGQIQHLHLILVNDHGQAGPWLQRQVEEAGGGGLEGMTCYTLVLGKTETDAIPGDTGDCDYKQLREGRGIKMLCVIL